MKKRLRIFPLILSIFTSIVTLFTLVLFLMTELSNFNIINIALPSWLFPLSVIAVNLFGAAWLAVMTRISKKEEQNNDNQVKKNNSFYVFAFIVMALIAVIYTVKLFNILIG